MQVSMSSHTRAWPGILGHQFRCHCYEPISSALPIWFRWMVFLVWRTPLRFRKASFGSIIWTCMYGCTHTHVRCYIHTHTHTFAYEICVRDTNRACKSVYTHSYKPCLYLVHKSHMRMCVCACVCSIVRVCVCIHTYMSKWCFQMMLSWSGVASFKPKRPSTWIISEGRNWSARNSDNGTDGLKCLVMHVCVSS